MCWTGAGGAGHVLLCYGYFCTTRCGLSLRLRNCFTMSGVLEMFVFVLELFIVYVMMYLRAGSE